MRCNKPEAETLQTVTIAGRFCESGDILIREYRFLNLEKAIYSVFTIPVRYNYSMSSNYNRVPKPAMVLVNNSQSDIIIERETS